MWRAASDVALAAHPESFQLDRQSNRIYVNVPKEQAIIVLDQASGHRIASWSTGNGSNFPLALNAAAGHVLVVLRNPAALVAFAASSGTAVAQVEPCGDADDMFVDTRRRRVYVSCGDGFLDVFDANAYKLLERIPTVKRARTSLFIPEIDLLFVAARATAEAPAAVWAFRPRTMTVPSPGAFYALPASNNGFAPAFERSERVMPDAFRADAS